MNAQLDKVGEFRFIFTSPTFIKEQAEKQKNLRFDEKQGVEQLQFTIDIAEM